MTHNAEVSVGKPYPRSQQQNLIAIGFCICGDIQVQEKILYTFKITDKVNQIFASEMSMLKLIKAPFLTQKNVSRYLLTAWFLIYSWFLKQILALSASVFEQ